MRPNIWGKHIWYSVHYIALAYPMQPTDEEKEQYLSFYLSVGQVLPCKKCRINFADHLTKLPLDNAVLANRNTLFAWTVHLHNEVNKSTGKDVQWSVEQALEYYKKYTGSHTFGNMPSTGTSNVIIVCVLMVLLVFVTLWMAHARRQLGFARRV